MRKQHIIYRLCYVGFAISLILVSLFSFDFAKANISKDKAENLIARSRGRLRLTGAKPGGDTTKVGGRILIPKESNIFQENPGDNFPLIARFTGEVYFQVEVWDPNIRNRDGAGIERIEIAIFKGQQEIYRHTEKYSPYCFFENGQPCGSIGKYWPSGQLIRNGQYEGYVNIYLTNRRDDNDFSQWFFSFEIQRSS